MSRIGLAGAAACIAAVAWSADALAVDYTTPFGPHPVVARIGSDAWGQWIGWQDVTTNECAWDLIGDTSGIWESTVIHGSSGPDAIFVQDSTVTFCDWPIGPPSFNGYYIQLLGNAGNDMLWSPTTFKTHFLGGAGDDWINSGYASAEIYGDDGDDVIHKTGSGFGGEQHGDAGNDCLSIDPALSPLPTWDVCGDGTDLWSGPATRPSDCEYTDTTCCGFC